MINVVIDTNVIVSAAISPFGNPAKVIDIVFAEERFQMYYSPALFIEYEEVLSRPKFSFPEEIQSAIKENIKFLGIIIEPPKSIISVPDESDRQFYDVAKASGAILITGNLAHYPEDESIMNPADFLRYIGVL
jgi:putative PIN family toxin of toxin-antitoxin system